MATTREDIKEWCERGIKEGATHMIVVCDTFDWEDYPVYVKKGEDAKKKYEQYASGANMQKVMEVYNLTKDLTAQLSKHRNFEF